MQRRRETAGAAGGLGKKREIAVILRPATFVVRAARPRPEEWARQRVTVTRQPLRPELSSDVSETSLVTIPSRGLPAEATTPFHSHRHSSKSFPISGSP